MDLKDRRINFFYAREARGERHPRQERGRFRTPGFPITLAVLTWLAVSFSGCLSFRAQEPIATVLHVDLPRFMGDWHVIANTPTFLEKDAYNAVESYRLNEDGTIATTFTFRKGSFNGRKKRYTPKGFVLDRESNAVWGMRFLWPFKGDFRILYLNEDYTQTVIGRQKRDYVWIMAREPRIPQEDFRAIIQALHGQGYDISKIEMVPQNGKALGAIGAEEDPADASKGADA